MRYLSSAIDHLGLPECAQCKKPVDELIRLYDNLRMCMIFVVRCHGAEERVELTDKLLYEFSGGMSFGQAFVTKALPTTVPALSETTNAR